MKSRTLWLAGLFLGILLTAASPVSARDVFVLYSGGGTPLTNNYSQYLQARAMASFLLDRYPPDSVWIFFGAGNREGEAAVFSDVRRQRKWNGTIVESWLPGVLSQNRRADKETFLTALRDEVLPSVREGGTLYLFVGDHGTQQKDGLKESLITLWQMKRAETRGGWRSDATEELSVTELRDVVAAGIGRGQVVFCMTQCHSGGFHFLGTPRSVAPDPAWFEGALPEWAASAEKEVLPLAAGFTATDEDSLAAGCDPDPDPDRWAGYERYVPEMLLGIDLFTHELQRAPLTSFAQAHEAAVLLDQTIDKPRATSEVYLERWAATIERLAKEKNLVAPLRAAVADYQATVETGLARGEGTALARSRETFAGFVERLTEQCSSAATALRSGTRAELEALFAKPEGRPTPPGGAQQLPAAAGLASEWKEKLRPLWIAAVDRGEIGSLTGPALEFERHLQMLEANGRDVMFPRSWQNPMLNDLFWHSSYADPARLEQAKADAVTRWGATRRSEIAAWAEKLEDEELRGIGRRMKPRPFLSGPRPLRPAIAAERVLFYRRTLAAWRFLQQVGAASALAELERLSVLERTPLPAGGNKSPST